jgi:methionine biosynthesis protein MetW
MATPASSTETNKKKMNLAETKLEYRIILDLVRQDSSVLDLGCGDGTLLALLVKEKNARTQGIEIDEKAIYECVGKDLSVFQGDVDSGLSEYPEKSFDYVILNQSFQQVKNPDTVLNEALRVGKEVIVGFPNFAYYTARWQLALGRAPVTSSLPYQWYNTPNTHFFSIADFKRYCKVRNIKIKKTAFVSGNRRINFLPNLLAGIGIFLISR